MPKIKSWFHTYGLFLLFMGAVLIIIEVVVQKKIVPSFIIPAPTGVIAHIIDNWRPLLFVHLKATIQEFFIGFAIAVGGGVAFAVSMFFSKTMEKILYPAVLISQMIPIIALSPIFVLWFGYTLWSKVAVTVLMSFFPIVVATYDGLKSCDKEYIELLRSMGAKRRHLFVKLHVPMALPSMFSGLKIAVIYSLVGATIGEWLGASVGLGYYSRRMSGDLNADGVFAAIVILTIVGILFFSITTIIEKRAFSWKNES